MVALQSARFYAADMQKARIVLRASLKNHKWSKNAKIAVFFGIRNIFYYLFL